MRMFNRIHEKTFSFLQKMGHKLDIQLAYIPACVAQMDAYSTFPALNIKHLHKLSHTWLKTSDALQQVLMALPPVDGPSTFHIVGST
jgi:hypothetical protein